MRLKIMIGTLTALMVLMVMFPMPAAYAYTWYSEDNGEAHLTVEWGAPYMTIAEYSTHTLKLGERCITYASATAEGSMYVHGWATETTWVSGSIYWYQRGCLAVGGTGAFNAWIHVKFQAVDLTADALVEKVVLDEHGPWSDEGTWHFDQLDILLTQNHYYKFALYVEVHADAAGLGAAIADFGGIWWEDSRIEWGYLEVPYVALSLPTLTISASYGGTTDPAPGTCTYDYGSVVTVTAIPDSDFYFTHWVLDGETVYGNPITVTMDSDHSLEAHFNSPPDIPSQPSGQTFGTIGATYLYSTSTTDPDGDDIEYQFDWGDGEMTSIGWCPSSTTVSVSYSWDSPGTYYVKVRAKDVFGVWSDWSSSLEVFMKRAGGTCPTLFAWNGSVYVYYGVIDIHNPTGEDLIREVPVQAEDVGINNYKAKFRLREGWEGLNFSESFIDQVKLYAVDSQGNRYLCPLISATHNILGKVLPQLLASDDYRVQMLLLETIDLTFTVPYPTSQIQGYVFVIEGCNPYKV